VTLFQYFFDAVMANDGFVLIHTGAAKGADDVRSTLISRIGTATATAWLGHNVRPVLLEGDRFRGPEVGKDDVESLVRYR
jgi:hypothetical protein